MNKQNLALIVALLFNPGICADSSGKRPPIPSEWMTVPKPAEEKTGPFSNILIQCGSMTRGYGGNAPNEISNWGRRALTEKINTGLQRIGVNKPLAELNITDIPYILDSQIQQEYDVSTTQNNRVFYCHINSLKNHFAFRAAKLQIDQELQKRGIPESVVHNSLLFNDFSSYWHNITTPRLLTNDEVQKIIKRIVDTQIMGPFSGFVTPSGTHNRLEGDFGWTSSAKGNIVFTPSYILNILYDSIGSQDTIMDIGGAIGIQAFPLLTAGAKVTVVDLSDTDLKKLTDSIPHDLRQNLETITANFPNSTNLNRQDWKNKFNIILMSHVAHYLTGDELRTGIQSIWKWLKPGGRLFFQALTPYSNPYAWRMFQDEEAQKQGAEWPGYFTESEKIDFKNQFPEKNVTMFDKHSMPNSGHPISPQIIQRELENNGFEVTYINYGSFASNLIGKTYPVSYQELEAYVKRHIIPISTEDEKQIHDKLSEFPDLLEATEIDADLYKEQATNPRSAITPLQTMSTIMVITKKKEHLNNSLHSEAKALNMK